MSIGNPHVELAVRNPNCAACRMAREATGSDVCRTAEGDHTADILVVSRNALGDRQRKELFTYLSRAGFDPTKMAFTGASKCMTWELTPNKTDLKACKPYLEQEIEFIKPKWILALGNEALNAVVGRSGIMKYRGKIFERKDGIKAMATISPAAVYRNPGQKGGFEADLKYLYNTTAGVEIGAEPDPDQYHKVMNRDDLKELVRVIETSSIASVDIESNGFDEFKSDARMVSIAVTLERYVEDTLETRTDVYAIPLWHPESPWRNMWERVLQIIIKALRRVRKRIAHNGKFDCRWIHQFGGKFYLTFDTMLAAALLDENRPKGLKPLGQQLLGAKPWGVDTAELVNMPLDEVLWYNALDTWHTLSLYRIFREHLNDQWRLKKMFTHIIMPASNVLVDVERHGVWTDEPKMRKHWAISQNELDGVDERLYEWVPEEHPFIIDKRRRGGEIERIENVNWNPSNFSRWFLFDYLGLPVLERGKEKDNGNAGDPSVKESVLMELRDDPGHEVIDLLLERSKWQKYTSSFFSAYAEQVDANSRIHTTFKLSGTVTGRLSSGKPDDDKVTSKKQNRGVNLQQVPRDPFVRGVFGAAPGNFFVEFDFSQIELRIAAFLAQERNMLRLYAQGMDIHMAMAMRMTGKPEHMVTKEERKRAKPVNFGFLYGMAWAKFVATAWEKYQIRFTEVEARAARKQFFDEFPGLQNWYARQIREAHQFGYVTSPMGRIRHLPDIKSRNQGVVAEAERQAINSPVQALASDMALWSMVLVTKEFRRLGLKATAIGTVHDAVNYEIPREELAIALPIIKDIMENLPLEEVFQLDLNVPIIADCKVGTRWGGATEISAEDVYNFTDDILERVA
jgi:uracil-DNA glycosylase family 4